MRALDQTISIILTHSLSPLALSFHHLLLRWLHWFLNWPLCVHPYLRQSVLTVIISLKSHHSFVENPLQIPTSLSIKGQVLSRAFRVLLVLTSFPEISPHSLDAAMPGPDVLQTHKAHFCLSSLAVTILVPGTNFPETGWGLTPHLLGVFM